LLLKDCKGYELEKEKPNTSEDFFNQSEVVYVANGKEKTFQVLYIRYFDEKISEFTPYSGDPIFQVGSRDVTFKDIVALACLMKNPEFQQRKRLYINNMKELVSYFEGLEFEKIPEIFRQIEDKNGFTL
jgi:hypothetical protein